MNKADRIKTIKERLVKLEDPDYKGPDGDDWDFDIIPDADAKHHLSRLLAVNPDRILHLKVETLRKMDDDDFAEAMLKK